MGSRIFLARQEKKNYTHTLGVRMQFIFYYRDKGQIGSQTIVHEQGTERKPFPTPSSNISAHSKAGS